MQKLENSLVDMPHASANWGPFAGRCALTPLQQILWSDYLTTQIADIGLETVQQLRSNCARFVDLNREHGTKAFATKDFGQLPDGSADLHPLWLPGKELTVLEQKWLSWNIHAPYYERATLSARQFRGHGMILDLHDAGRKVISKWPDGKPRWMPDMILCNNGDPGKADVADPANKKLLTCNPQFLRELQEELKRSIRNAGIPLDDPELNTYNPAQPNIDECEHFANSMNTYRHDNALANHVDHSVEGVMIEVCTEPFFPEGNPFNPNMVLVDRFRIAFEEAARKVYANVRTWNV